MLKKLLKYDLLNVYKVLVVFYILAIIFAGFTRIFLNINNSTIFNIIGQICSGICISMIFNIIINNIMRVWVRFSKNLYGDESYLTHTLPVNKKTIYLSKFLTSIITMFTSVIMIILSVFIAYYSKENLEFVRNLLTSIANIYDSTVVNFLLVTFFVFFLELTVLLQAGYTGLILGNKMNNNKLLFSILFGFISYIVTQVFTLILIFIAGIFNQEIMNLFMTNEIANLEMLNVIMYLAIAIYLLCIIIYYFIDIKIFNKGVNVD